jgi:hypothetical protein
VHENGLIVFVILWDCSQSSMQSLLLYIYIKELIGCFGSYKKSTEFSTERVSGCLHYFINLASWYINSINMLAKHHELLSVCFQCASLLTEQAKTRAPTGQHTVPL